MSGKEQPWYYFPGWIMHPYILFGIFVLLVFGAGFLSGWLVK